MAFTFLVSACNGSGNGGPDASAYIDAATLTCQQIRAALGARTQAVSKQCTTVSDCTAVGFATWDYVPTCNCAPSFSPGSCGGVGVNAAAWQADDEAQALLVEWEERCVVPGACGMYSICGCDCGFGGLTCSSNGFCVVGIDDCFNQGMPDAMPDSSPGDASVD